MTNTSAGSPTSSRPSVSRPSTRAGTADAASQRLLERHAEHVEVSNGLDHRHDAAGEHPGGAADRSVLHAQLDAAEAERAAARARELPLRR